MEVRELENFVYDRIFIVTLLFVLVIVISLIVLIIQLIIKKKRKSVTITVMVYSSIILVMLILYYIQHIHTIQYNDWKIIGSNIYYIEKEYGAFDYEIPDLIAGYYIYDDRFGDEVYYLMEYNDIGVVTHVFISDYNWM